MLRMASTAWLPTILRKLRTVANESGSLMLNTDDDRREEQQKKVALQQRKGGAARRGRHELASEAK